MIKWLITYLSVSAALLFTHNYFSRENPKQIEAINLVLIASLFVWVAGATADWITGKNSST